MAKKMFSKLSVLVVLIAFLASCSNTSNYIQVIPADAPTVVSVKLKTLAEKAGLNDKENEAIKQKMLETMKGEINAATFQQLEKIVNHPDESGIDVAAPFYLFSSPSFPYTSFVGKVSDQEDLRNSLELMAKENIFQPIVDEDGYSYSQTKGGILVFNESTVMLVNVKRASQIEKAKEAIAVLMKQSIENSIAQSGAFQKMEEQDDDIHFFSNLKEVPSAYFEQATLGIPADINPEDITVVGGVNFEKGRVALKGEYYTEKEETKALLEKHMAAMGKGKGTFNDLFPSSTVMYCNINLKGEKFYEQIAEYKDFRNTISIAKAEEMKEIFKAIKGDMSFGLINITMTKAPTFMFYADFDDAKILEKLYQNKKDAGLKRGEDIVELSKNEYVYKSRGTNVFYGIKDKKLYATNDELLYKNVGKPAEKSINETDYATEIEGKSVFFAIDSKAVLDLPIVKMATVFGGPKVKLYIAQAVVTSYIAGSVENNQFTLELSLKNKDMNALKLIVGFVKELTGLK